ncbi:RluA family pseudouridine synthase [Patescibacteria group bacterium]
MLRHSRGRGFKSLSAHMELKTIYEDENVLVVDKPAGIIVYSEKPTEEETLIDFLLKNYPHLKNFGKDPRHGIVHRLDKDTSGIILIAKNDKALSFLQNQFKSQKVVKKYFALVVGNIKEKNGTIKTLIGREPKKRKKQKAYLPLGPEAKKKGKRMAITNYSVLEKFLNGKNYYTLVEVKPKTGRKHQIRTHFSHIGFPIAKDKMYGFKNQPKLKDLKRQFLHACYLNIKLINNEEKEFKSNLPEDLKGVLNKLQPIYD